MDWIVLVKSLNDDRMPKAMLKWNDEGRKKKEESQGNSGLIDWEGELPTKDSQNKMWKFKNYEEAEFLWVDGQLASCRENHK